MSTLAIVALCATLLILAEWHAGRTPLSREAYLEKRRILERDRAELAGALKCNPYAPVHMKEANNLAIEKIDHKLLALADRMPIDLVVAQDAEHDSETETKP